jgi:hypothetical protein
MKAARWAGIRCALQYISAGAVPGPNAAQTKQRPHRGCITTVLPHRNLVAPIMLGRIQTFVRFLD